MAATTSHISKLQLLTEKDKITLERAEKELEEGMAVLAERQKHIRIADQSEHSCFPFPLPVSVFLGFYLPIVCAFSFFLRISRTCSNDESNGATSDQNRSMFCSASSVPIVLCSKIFFLYNNAMVENHSL